ncbi:MAG: hypothetical protein ACLPPV_05000 [Candidatus Korobacteraceae bacterium]
MKKIIVGLILLSVSLFVSPAAAQVVYSNGPTNGNTDAWAINFGAIVSDTFNIADGNTTITGASFAMWLFSGDTLTSAELSITSGEHGGTSYFDETVGFTQGSCTGNKYGYVICTENTSFNGPTLNSGTYWLHLQNASVPDGDPVYWDENSGPSQAFRCCGTLEPATNAVGTIPSESFTLMGSSLDGKNSNDGNPQSTPEPSSILVLGSGILSVAAALRLKTRR